MALRTVVKFKRLRGEFRDPETGEHDESRDYKWKCLGTHRGDCEQTSSGESQSDDQQEFVASWTVVCRGDTFTRNITHQDRLEFVAHGRKVTLNITGIRTIRNVPHWLEFTGEEA